MYLPLSAYSLARSCQKKKKKKDPPPANPDIDIPKENRFTGRKKEKRIKKKLHKTSLPLTIGGEDIPSLHLPSYFPLNSSTSLCNFCKSDKISGPSSPSSSFTPTLFSAELSSGCESGVKLLLLLPGSGGSGGSGSVVMASRRVLVVLVRRIGGGGGRVLMGLDLDWVEWRRDSGGEGATLF